MSLSANDYRLDIDCLRMLAVVLVVLFHCGFSLFQGGYIGVDLFFVISGYVMSRVFTHHELTWQSLVLFYQKRILRIYPALLGMLILTTIFGALWLSTNAFDYFGKQMFFAGLSVSNLFYARGFDYFSAVSPLLLHTWSLAVEMQFYLIFPLIILLQRIFHVRLKISPFYFCSLLAILFFAWAEFHSHETKSFFLTDRRIFEFLIGAAAANLPSYRDLQPKISLYIIILCLFGIVLFSMFIEPKAHHPGLYTLPPTLACAYIMVYFASKPCGDHVLLRSGAYVGKLSYGIYLYHFPVIIFGKEIFHLNSLALLACSLFITFPLAYFSYRYVETPIRRSGYVLSRRSLVATMAVIFLALGLSAFGYLTAKAGGWPQRLKYFNSYAYSVSVQHTQRKESFKRGINISKGEKGRILFVGDSVLEQYIDPIVGALGIPKEQVDSITRGGCLLLKGGDFIDSFADISCNGLKSHLYMSDKHYDYVVFSQDWGGYGSLLRNAVASSNNKSFDYLAPFLIESLEHFKGRGSQIIMLGVHPVIGYDALIEISPMMSQAQYIVFRDSLVIEDEVPGNRAFMDDVARRYDAQIFHPIDIFCTETLCETHNDEWGYFFDSQHVTQAGQEKAEVFFNDRLKNLQ